MKLNLLFTAITLSIFSFSLSAQQQSSTNDSQAQPERKYCYTDQMDAEAVKNNPGVLQVRAQLEQAMRDWIKQHPNQVSNNNNYIIPVVFHVLHNYGTENISDAQIHDQMRIWNEDYQKKNADTVDIVPQFKSIAANCGIEFRLATIDPNGNCTNGIERIVTTLTYNAGDNAKSLSTWPQNKYLNIWTAATLMNSGAAAYAYYPGLNCPTCGVMSSSDYIGSIGTGNYDNARVISHETGHCFNLWHTFGDSNGDPNPPSCHVRTGCNDDNVSDTPLTRGWTCCNLGSANNCNAGIVENVQNFMEYSYCDRMFTQGQKTRMQSALNTYASFINMWSPANLTATGTADPYVTPLCAPVTDFHASRQMVCVGDSITFTDDSWKGHPTTRNWTFNGGIPISSSDSAPTVRYNTPGNYAVTLISSNSSGSNSKTKTGYITVVDTTAMQVPFMEGFEGTFPPANSVIQTPNGGPSWQRATVGHNSTYSLKMNNYNTSAVTNGSVTEYITLAYSFVNITSPKVFFDLAYALRSTDTTLTDGVKVYYSLNCGHGWVQRYSKTGSPLVTATPRSNFSFTPTANDWRTESVSVGSILSGKPNVRFRFEGVNGNGNNVYIDNININGIVAVDEDMAVSDFEIYPNPAKDYATVEISLAKNTEVRMELFDIAGRKIATIVNDRMLAGTHRFPLNQKLQAGVYFVNLTSGMATTSKRLVILQ